MDLIVKEYILSSPDPASAPGMTGIPFHSATGVPDGRDSTSGVGVSLAGTEVAVAVTEGTRVAVVVVVVVAVGREVAVEVRVGTGELVTVGVAAGSGPNALQEVSRMAVSSIAVSLNDIIIPFSIR